MGVCCCVGETTVAVVTTAEMGTTPGCSEVECSSSREVSTGEVCAEECEVGVEEVPSDEEEEEAEADEFCVDVYEAGNEKLGSPVAAAVATAVL